MTMNKSKKSPVIYINMYVTPTNTKIYIHTAAHMHIYTLFINQVR